jgi:O-antigen ligase
MTSYIQLHQKKLFNIFTVACCLFIIICFAIQQPLAIAAILLVPIIGLAIYDFRIFYWLLVGVLPISFNLIEFGSISLDVPDEPLMLGLTLITPFVYIQNARTSFVKYFISHPIIFLLIAWTIWTLACSLAGTDIPLSLKFFLSKIWYLTPFVAATALIVYQDITAVKKMFTYFLISLCLIIIYVTKAHASLGFSFEDVNMATAPIFRNHVLYGSIASLSLPIIIGAIFNTKKFTTVWWLLIIALGIDFTALTLAYSRGAWAAAFFAGAIFFAVKIKWVGKMMLGFYALVFSAIIWISIDGRFINFAPRFSTGIMHDNLIDHLIATVKGKDISSNERFFRWVAAVRMSEEHPLMGIGPNNFYDHYKGYAVNNFRTYVSRNEEKSTTHNYFLYMLVEQGIIGVFFYATFIFMVFYRGQQLYHRIQDKHTRVVLISVLAMMGAFFINNFLSELLENDKIGGMFLIGVGILIALEARELDSTPTTTKIDLVDMQESLV